MKSLKAIVVGVGHLGKEHARIYSKISDVELVGVVDLDAAQASKVGHSYGVPGYTRLEEVKETFHLASVAVPTVHHFEVAQSLLQRGIHVLVEKPITQTIEQATTLVKTAKERGLILQVGHIERYNPAFKALTDILDEPRYIECHRLSPFPNRGTDVGVVLDLMIHDIDAILHLTRSQVTEIRAVGVPVLSSYEDIANARLEFKNGCIANLTTSRVSIEKMRKIRVFQSNAYISLDYMKQEGKIYQKVGNQIVWKNIPFEKAEPLVIEISSFVDCVRQTHDPLVSGEQGKKALEVAMEVLTTIQKSNKTGNGGSGIVVSKS